MPSGQVPHYGVMPHYWSCLLCVLPHYQPCLLVGCPFIGHVFCLLPLQPLFLLVESRWKRDAISVVPFYSGDFKSGMSSEPVPFSYIPDCTVQLYQTYMLGSFIQIYEFVKCSSIRHGIWLVSNPSDMPTGRAPFPIVCKNHSLPSWTPF